MPWISKLATAVLRGRLEQEQEGLAREAVQNLERLGPTFVKLGQVSQQNDPAIQRSLYA